MTISNTLPICLCLIFQRLIKLKPLPAQGGLELTQGIGNKGALAAPFLTDTATFKLSPPIQGCGAVPAGRGRSAVRGQIATPVARPARGAGQSVYARPAPLPVAKKQQ